MDYFDLRCSFRSLRLSIRYNLSACYDGSSDKYAWLRCLLSKQIYIGIRVKCRP
jgi:hypothetical protein